MPIKVSLRADKRGLVLILGSFFIYYVGTYAVLSLAGGYRFMRSGNSRPFGLAMADTYYWQPLFGHYHPFRDASGKKSFQADVGGVMFAPLVLLDQELIHPSIEAYAFEDDLEPGSGFKPPPEASFHPFSKRALRIKEKYIPERKKARATGEEEKVKQLGDKMSLELHALTKRYYYLTNTFYVVWYAGLCGTILIGVRKIENSSLLHANIEPTDESTAS